MCSGSIAMIVGGGNGNDGKTFMQWDSTFAAQSQ
jgi:hypothetical protein